MGDRGPAAGDGRGAPHRDAGSRPTLLGRVGIDTRALTVVLGILWLVDAVLELQPRMWGTPFVDQMILPMAHGQPAPLAWSIEQMGRFLRPDAGVWNFLFASVQLGIGVGLLVRRTLRPALVVMFAWCLGVWWFGEGFGGILTGAATPLTGAPGAVLLYALVGALIWPRATAPDRLAVDEASAPLAQGRLGASAPRTAWAAVWAVGGLLLVFPANRGTSSVHAVLRAVSAGQPAWYAHVLGTVAGWTGGHGVALAWVLALASLAIGFGPLVARRAGPFVVAGIALQLAYWVTGQAVGNVLTGMGTDVQTAPLVVLLGIGLLPARVSVSVPAGASAWSGAGTPQRVAARPRRVVAVGGLALVGAALLVSATYPAGTAADAAGVAPAPAPAGSMPGMAMTVSSGGTARPATGTGPAWHYTGPGLPAPETRLLTAVFAATERGHAMQTAHCTAAPTVAQEQAAFRLVQETSAAVARYRDLSTAVADGYVPVTDTAYPVIHYVKPAYLQQQYVLDPLHVQSLVYAITPNGPVLAAAMFLMPRVGEPGPMPGGCLTQWHAHTNLCVSDQTGQISGFTPCSPGMHPLVTQEMLHVWQLPVPGGPLAMDPSDLQVVEAAMMAQQQGLAPLGAPGAPGA